MKPASDFSRNRRSKDGLAFYCKICNNARSPASRPRRHGGLGQFGDDRERLASAITCLLEADPKEREIADLARQRARELTTSSV